MRTLPVFIVFLLLAVAAPPDSFDLHSRFGKPNMERFTVRPDITMTADYGPDGPACFLNIRPRQPFIKDLDFHPPEMSMETAVEVLNQVVPIETRGKFLIDGPSFQAGCGGGTSKVYENLTISFGLDYCSKPFGVQVAMVRFKRSVCPTPCSSYVVNPQGEKICAF